MNLRIVNTLKLTDPLYPSPLKDIHKPPSLLYYKGAAPHAWLDRPKVAVVGSRKATAYGRAVTQDIATQLARAGVVIISGLAYGIDAVAHQAALEANGLAVAVLATPLNKIYPASHHQLAMRIVAQGGTLISENGENSKIYRNSFLERNRIISSLADAIVIPEAAERSGSLNTARLGLEQGKSVMAVPGNITSPTSAGCNNLIKSGALPVTEVEDIFFALGFSRKDRLVSTNFRGTEEEEMILQLIRDGISSQDELAITSAYGSQQINAALTVLEIAGAIRPLGGGNWAAV